MRRKRSIDRKITRQIQDCIALANCGSSIVQKGEHVTGVEEIISHSWQRRRLTRFLYNTMILRMMYYRLNDESPFQQANGVEDVPNELHIEAILGLGAPNPQIPRS